MTRGYDPSPLPDSLHGAIFDVATARDAGATPARLRATDLDRTVYGVRAPAEAGRALVDRCRMFAARLGPDVFFSHGTAALLYGAPLPWRLERHGELHVSVPAPARAPHAAGLVGHSRRVIAGDVVAYRGVRMSSPARVVCELARTLDLPDLVAVIDSLIQWRGPLTSTSAIAERAAAGDRLGRGRKVAAALELSSERSESRPESLLRVLLARMGLPEPKINHVVVATETGVRGIRTDFAFPDLKVAIEYQGDYHRSKDQWRADMTRRTRLEAEGWYVLELNADDLRDPAELATRIRAILARRAHTPR